jgi:hypothetical protein
MAVVQAAAGGAVASIGNRSQKGKGHTNPRMIAETTESTPPASNLWRRSLVDLRVAYVWAYDTTAILAEYDDSEAGVLPAGQSLRFSAVAEQPEHFLCDLDDPRFIEKHHLPSGRVHRFRPWCFATRIQAVIRKSDYHQFTVESERPSRLKRWYWRFRS